MLNFSELTSPFEFVMPPDSLERLGVLSAACTGTDEPVLTAERNYMEGIVVIAEQILVVQGPKLKKPVQVSSEKEVLSPPNCTDSAAAILYVCGVVNVPAYAHFNGFHSSVTTTGASPETYWSLDMFKAMYQTSASGLRQEAIVHSLASLADGTGLQFWSTCSADERRWYYTNLYGPDIRDHSRRIKKENHPLNRGFAIVNTPVAFRMLRALDVLNTLRNNQVSLEAARSYSDGKAALGHLIPKL